MPILAEPRDPCVISIRVSRAQDEFTTFRTADGSAQSYSREPHKVDLRLLKHHLNTSRVVENGKEVVSGREHLDSELRPLNRTAELSFRVVVLPGDGIGAL